MKNSEMPVLILLLIFIVIVFLKIPTSEVKEMCFTRNTEDGGSENIILKSNGSKVSGEFYYLPAEKDKKTGEFTVVINGKEINALWKAASEGVTQTEELKILLDEGVASPGFGEMKKGENNVYVYANSEKINYSMNLSLIDCKESPLK